MSKRRRPWYGQWTLAHRILAVNLLTIVLLAFGVLYLDAFRNQLSEGQLNLVRREADIAASVLTAVPSASRDKVAEHLARSSDSRVRLYDPEGALQFDSWQFTGPTYELRDPNTQKWNKDAARAADRAFNALVGA